MDSKSLVKIAKALSDPHRLHILEELAKTPTRMCHADLSDCIKVSQPSMSQHLKALEDAGLIEMFKEGRSKYLSIKTDKVDELESFLKVLKPI